LAAACLRIPIYLQEQNVSVGIANKILGRFAKAVFLGFPQAQKHFPRGICIDSGNPIRSEFANRKPRQYDPSSRRILIMGGSQGARAINEAIMDLLPQLRISFPNLKIVHQTGKLDLEKVAERYAPHHPNFSAFAFIDNVIEEYEKASLVICRAGAITVSELVFTSRPAVFIPYPRKGQNDQVDNARLMESHGVARVVEQGDDFSKRLLGTIRETLEDRQLSEMHKKYYALQKACALVTIADRIEQDLANSSSGVNDVQEN
jgi:UDP-N-acetylglucosamine--N-acetylmuramyl-(pentapeptide) pyrophosphoryl-undecaprenol N-acetylglucosamine transferase